MDLETSGSSDKAAIVEIGAVLTDATPQLNELATFTVTIAYEGEWENEIVSKMMEDSGLAADIEDGYTVPNIAAAEGLLLDWLNKNAGKDTNHIPWGGSGVCHFDAKFIRRDMPKFSKRITWWTYDIGSVRRFLQLANVEVPRISITKTHRALDDALVHVEESRQAIVMFRRQPILIVKE